ncbi:MAG TPA: ABC transporter substrate-binding protein [Candidatus Scatomorpha pullistercoris]|uniref:ABC transporter substrate-binding protein n=1 Tax=Candidatus Scatomorpha pullistercoris TaxID=2840929 RepID=A0A9D1G406_9FIRM|nr:ABC transporter substrate-binding protein [Candidatus Scatomorpha pullistercoris]
MKKILAILLAAVMLLALAACGTTNDTTTEPPAATDPVETEPAATEPADDDTTGETYVVGICQQMTHVALDAATEGFKAALTDILGEGAVTYEEGNAGGDQNNCVTIVDGLVSEGVDLILANATWPLQAAASATGDIPILGTSITDYATALNLDGWTGTVGNNISGTSDLAPLDQQAEMIHELFPDAENIGLLYCSGEANSVYQIETIRGYLEDMGYTCEAYAFTDVNDLSSVTQTACDNSDVIYIPTDNTAAGNTETIANIVLAAGVPVVAGESGICSGCGVATLSIDYYELGYTTGEMAAKILTGEADVTTMAVEYAPNVTKMYNAANCEALGLTMPEDYVAIEG